MRSGAAFYARDPRNWLGPLRRAAPPDGPWTLLRPEPAAAAWAAAEVEGLAPDWVIANYVNAAEVFAQDGGSGASRSAPSLELRGEAAAFAAMGKPTTPPAIGFKALPRRTRVALVAGAGVVGALRPHHGVQVGLAHRLHPRRVHIQGEAGRGDGLGDGVGAQADVVELDLAVGRVGVQRPVVGYRHWVGAVTGAEERPVGPTDRWSINVKDLAQGQYVIRLITTDLVRSARFVVQH